MISDQSSIYMSNSILLFTKWDWKLRRPIIIRLRIRDTQWHTMNPWVKWFDSCRTYQKPSYSTLWKQTEQKIISGKKNDDCWKNENTNETQIQNCWIISLVSIVIIDDPKWRINIKLIHFKYWIRTRDWSIFVTFHYFFSLSLSLVKINFFYLLISDCCVRFSV